MTDKVREALADLRDFIASSRQFEINLELREQLLSKIMAIKDQDPWQPLPEPPKKKEI